MSVPVYVINLRGQPLMPTTTQNARKLLKQDRAKVVKRSPFTIQLQRATGETKQEIILGIDAGYSCIGFSAVTRKKELISGELILRKDVSKRLTKRSQYRRTRRNRLWYRKPRFKNRIATKKKGWLAPSIQHKLDSHLRLVTFLQSLLPITQVIVEVASFDTQKLLNPDIQGIEYQQGTLFGYTIRNYLLEKWGHYCAYCRKTGIPLEIEHIIPKSRGGSDRLGNLTIACHTCNQKKGNKLAIECSPKLHQRITAIQKQSLKSFKAATFMTMVRWKLVKQLKCQHTYGDHTKYQRTKLGLSKSHMNDAFVIASGSHIHSRSRSYTIMQIRRNNRSLQTNRKGFKPSIRRQRYPYQPNDLVQLKKKIYQVKGMFNYGTWVRLVSSTGQIVNSAIKHVKLIKYGKGFCFKFKNINSSSSCRMVSS